MADLPEPLVAADIDLTGFSSFMLDVDRLLTSELVAIGTPEECWAAHLLMCRAWKQSPPGSLPDDPRVLAAFSGAGKRWATIAPVALRDFVKCSDGRLYHPLLAVEAAKAWKKRQQYEADQFRLKNWRAGKKAGALKSERNGSETSTETADETRFNTASEAVSYPERQDRTGHIPAMVPLTGDSPPTKSRRKARPAGDLCPEDFRPSASHYAKATEWGRDTAWVDDIAERMRSWSQANANRETAWKANWSQALHDWLRDHRNDSQPIIRSGPGSRPTLANGSAPDRSTSGPASARDGIAAGLAALRGETH